jgi:hypothetical protein
MVETIARTHVSGRVLEVEAMSIPWWREKEEWEEEGDNTFFVALSPGESSLLSLPLWSYTVFVRYMPTNLCHTSNNMKRFWHSLVKIGLA